MMGTQMPLWRLFVGFLSVGRREGRFMCFLKIMNHIVYLMLNIGKQGGKVVAAVMERGVLKAFIY